MAVSRRESEPIQAAREAVARSDVLQGTESEVRLLREALRALIQWCAEREEA